MSNIVKSKFVGLLRGLLRRFDDGGERTVAPSRPVAASAPPPVAPQFRPQPKPGFRPQPKPQPALIPQPAAIAAPAAPVAPVVPPAAPAASTNNLLLPLTAIIAVLPMDLRAKLIQTPPPGAFVSIPMEDVLSQLAHGSVKTSFGELRAALPGLFDNSDENDARQIALPLNEIISRINPALLPRRAAKKIEVADSISGPFGMQTPRIAFTPPQPPAKLVPMPSAKTPEPTPAPAARMTDEFPPTFVRKAAAPTPAPAPIPFSPARAAAVAGPGDLQLPLSSVIALLPMDLCEKLIQTPPPGAYVPIPVEKAVSQLAHGSV